VVVVLCLRSQSATESAYGDPRTLDADKAWFTEAGGKVRVVLQCRGSSDLWSGEGVWGELWGRGSGRAFSGVRPGTAVAGPGDRFLVAFSAAAPTVGISARTEWQWWGFSIVSLPMLSPSPSPPPNTDVL
jgi:hypothetical protein